MVFRSKKPLSSGQEKLSGEVAGNKLLQEGLNGREKEEEEFGEKKVVAGKIF